MRKSLGTTRITTLLFAAVFTAFGAKASHAAPLAIRDTPLFITDNYAPLNMLVMGRDHKLYYEAYNDHSDLNEDAVLDVGYQPTIDYYGYFDSKKCYVYSSSDKRFNPTKLTSTKKCGGSSEWSGDWLNWATTSRLDALRKVLYGGLRSTDEAGGLTVIERSRLPQDAHGWVKEYISETVNGYKLRDYTPFGAPTSNKSHLFGSTTLYGATEPLLRVLENQQDNASQPLRAWNWASIERPVIGDAVVRGVTTSGAESRSAVTVDAAHTFSVRVRVCDSSIGLEDNCRAYVSGTTTVYKPIGLLQDFGENDAMKFGLITGSYAKNTDGGVLRSAIGSIRNEIDSTNGTFKTGVAGIITTLNRLHATGFKSDYSYNCGWITTRAINAGECQMWGNPIAEMMYESLRYFAGKSSATSSFSVAFGQGEEANLPGGGLPVATWDSNTNPYKTGNNPSCSKPFETVISDINPSYDTDKLPGVPGAFGSFTGDVSGLDVAALGQTIWNGEFGSGTSKKVFIGEVAGTSPDSAPTPKTASSFGDIRGLAPEEPTKQGGYYSASVAYFGHNNDLSTATGNQKLTTFAVALASPLPRIEIPVGTQKVVLVPFAKSVAGSSIDRTSSFQPTDQIVDFYVDSLTSTTGKFRVNFEDVEQGADHDMDAIAIYEYKVVGGNVEITLTSEYAAGGITQHMGYVISGTTHDGIYLEVVDQRGGDTATDVDYRLDTPPGKLPGAGTDWNDNRALPVGINGRLMEPAQPIKTTRTFTPGTSATADLLQDPLWYAAKWGGFKDLNKNGTPEKVEWDADNDDTPDNYFLVTNALTLKAQLSNAFEEIIARAGSASSAAVNSGSISQDSRLYQALFSTADWSGSLIAFKINENGSLDSSAWSADAAKLLPAPASRKIFTTTGTGTKVPFQWSDIGSTRQGQLQPSDTKGQERLNYLRGDRSKEIRNAGGYLRNRNPNTVLGDIVNAAPLYVGIPNFRYGNLESVNYDTYREDKKERKKMLYVGANDGMLHAFRAEDGREEWAFIPSAVFKNLYDLTNPGYQHRFYVDGSPAMGDVFYGGAWHTVVAGGLNNGGQGIYLLDVTDPTGLSDEQAIANEHYKWEFTDANDADLGYTYSRPVLVRVSNGKWVAIFGNGYNNTVNDGASTTSTTGNAVLYVVDVATGALLKKLDTGVGMSADPLATNRPNGLATPAVADLEGDFIADYVYAGDLFGNLWKFDITASDPTDWKVAYKNSSNKPLALFTAKDSSNKRQPITSKPSVILAKRGTGLQILFGTGKYMELQDRDINVLSTQSFYSVIDNMDKTSADIISGRSELTQQTILKEDTVNGRVSRVTSKNVPASNSRGWYIDLLSPGPTFKGEMVVSNSAVRNGRVLFSTLIPNVDPCGYGGTSFLMNMDARTGATSDYGPFDVNGDGVFNDSDKISVTLNGVTANYSVSGIASTVGITGSPAVVVSGDGTVEHQYQTGTGGEAADAETGGGGGGYSLSEDKSQPPPGSYGRQSWRQLR